MHSQALRSIPENKLKLLLKDIDDTVEDSKKRFVIKKAFERYYTANIPVKYWKITMEKDFHGDPSLMHFYKDVTCDLAKVYKNGLAVCLAGSWGLGKTFTITCILKSSLEKGYKALYVNLSDVVSAMKSGDSYIARKELLTTDFLCVDEFDPRYMATEQAADFYGRVLEDILRHRTQNNLPIFLCTNSSRPTESFSGALQQSIGSLMNYVKVRPVLGEDYRPKENK